MRHLVGLDESSNPSNHNFVIWPLVLGSKVKICHFLKIFQMLILQDASCYFNQTWSEEPLTQASQKLAQIWVKGHVGVTKVNDIYCVKKLKQGQMEKLKASSCRPWWKLKSIQLQLFIWPLVLGSKVIMCHFLKKMWFWAYRVSAILKCIIFYSIVLIIT